MSISPRRTAFALVIFAAVPLLTACPKKDPPVFDAGLPVVAPAEDVQTILTPMEDEAGADADADAPLKRTGTAVNTNVARLKQCCNQLAVQAKAMGASPEAGVLASAAAQCNTMAAQVAPNGTAPEMGVLRGILAGRTIPAACAGF